MIQPRVCRWDGVKTNSRELSFFKSDYSVILLRQNHNAKQGMVKQLALVCTEYKTANYTQ